MKPMLGSVCLWCIACYRRLRRLVLGALPCLIFRSFSGSRCPSLRLMSCKYDKVYRSRFSRLQGVYRVNCDDTLRAIRDWI